MSRRVFLREYIQLSQKVAEAIEAVMKIDVTIMDENMTRIAGTGIYRELINEKIEPFTAFDYCMKSGESYIIDRPKEHMACQKCPKRFNCIEKAEICVPTFFHGRVIGVIGIIAFTDEQKERILENKENFLDFLKKMAVLLEAKYSECFYSRENKKLSIRLGNIINSINEGLLVFNDLGEILYQNEALDKLLKEIDLIRGQKVEWKNNFILEVWKNPIIQSHIKSGKSAELQEIVIDYEDKSYTLYYSITIFQGNESRNEIIISLQSLKKVKKHIIRSVEEQKKVQFINIMGKSKNILEIKKLAEKAASVDSNVLIYGESGTGKELFARAIHNQSERRDYPFIPINCGAIPDQLLESELFGYERGAFTGAINTKMGKFEVADKGTIFLDEISELPFRLQVKLLRVLQEKEVCRIGSNNVRKVDVRIISATNTDLMRRIHDGLFREDLYYRINILPLNIPPLRERKVDIIYLAEYYVQYYAQLFKKDISGLAEDAKKMFINYRWPGNVRELQNVIEYAVNFESGKYITSNLIKKRIKVLQIAEECMGIPEFANDQFLVYYVNQTEKLVIEKKLAVYKNDKNRIKKICEDLNISRAKLYRKIKELEIEM